MGHAESQFAMTAQDFLGWEATQTIRHEFVDGEVFAMAGAEDRHVTVTLNVAMALRQHLAGSRCRTYVVDTKLHVARAGCYFYPDVLVTCDDADHANRQIKSNPKLIVEVLSPGTAAYDLGVKFSRYRLVDALLEYMVVDLENRRTDVYRKGGDGLWVLHPFEAGETVRLASVELAIDAAVLFAEIDPLPEAAQG